MRKSSAFPYTFTAEALSLVLVAVLTIATVRISELAGWLELPYLLQVSLIALVLGLALAKSGIIDWAGHSLSFVLGTTVVMGVGAATVTADGWSDRVDIVMHRLEVWWDIASEGGVTRDNLPLMLLLLFVAWLLSYLSMWLVLRNRFKWLAVVPSAVWILVNIRYIPPATSSYYGVYLMAIILFLGNIGLNRPWRSVQRFSYLALVFLVSLAFLTIAWKTPHVSIPQELGNVKSALEGQWGRIETSFNRYFAPNPTAVSVTGASYQAPMHTFGNEMTLKGGISLPQNPVMTLYSSIPGYSRGATYEFYTGRGWTQANPAGPFVARTHQIMVETYANRRELTQTIVVDSPTDVVFSIGQPHSSSMTATGFFPSAMTFNLPMDSTLLSPDLPEDVRKIGLELQRYYSERQVRAKGTVAAMPPTPGFTIKRIIRDGTEYRIVELTRNEPEPGEAAALRWPAVAKAGVRYTMVSSVSAASRPELQQAVGSYPNWVTDRYLQLPLSFPDSIRQLAYETTREYGNAYDRAKAVESYLRQLRYNIAVEAPPPNVDVVEHFLFKSKEGYCTYFASAMVVMLRSVDIPARVVTGFNIGQYDLEQDAFVIMEGNAHAWPEVFFPEYGWVEFEPSPSQLPILRENEEVPPPEEELEDEGLGADATEDSSAVIRNAAIALAICGLFLVLGILVWNLTLRGLPFPARVYERMRRFGYLAGMSNRPSETPYEYSRRLQAAIPGYSGDIGAIVSAYVEVTFSGVSWSRVREQEVEMEKAWRRVRQALVHNALSLSR